MCSTGGADLWFLYSSLPLVAGGLFGQVAGWARLRASNEGLPFLPHPSGRELKGAVGGVPHRARIGRALFHRARSASTRDGLAPTSISVFFLFPLWHVVT